MLINKMTVYLTLAVVNYSSTVLCLNLLVSPNYVKQAASNQASTTNERSHSTCSYDSTQTEYMNENEKYENPRMKIICKIKSSSAISLPQRDPTLIEKETTGIEQWSDYDWRIEEKSNPVRLHKNHRKYFHLPSKTHENREFFSRFTARGKCIGKCELEKASALTSVLVTPNDDESFTSHRSNLKRMIHHDELNHLKNMELLNHKNHRVRRQLRFIPTKHKNSLHFHKTFINSLMGVFDDNNGKVSSNFRRIKPNQFVITRPRYIDETKIIPVPFGFNTDENSLKPDGQPQFVKNTLRNLSGFGESQRVPTTDTERRSNKYKPIVEKDFLPTVRPSYEITQLSDDHSENNYYPIGEKSNPENHQPDGFGQSILSRPNNLHHQETPGTPSQRESSKYHGKDTKYDRYAAKYSFNYDVKNEASGNDFGHHETRNEQMTSGNYHVRLPDGRIQRVTYYVDEMGYHANVSYQSDNAHVESYEK